MKNPSTRCRCRGAFFKKRFPLPRLLSRGFPGGLHGRGFATCAINPSGPHPLVGGFGGSPFGSPFSPPPWPLPPPPPPGGGGGLGRGVVGGDRRGGSSPPSEVGVHPLFHTKEPSSGYPDFWPFEGNRPSGIGYGFGLETRALPDGPPSRALVALAGELQRRASWEILRPPGRGKNVQAAAPRGALDGANPPAPFCLASLVRVAAPLLGRGGWRGGGGEGFQSPPSSPLHRPPLSDKRYQEKPVPLPGRRDLRTGGVFVHPLRLAGG